ncbi:DUF6538 domain-containing protein [Laribacter hongkongensis]|uniref:DUF6538 domain-containing protein n=1 Tax=Laribacter hongkongensis TaxID=168471 RepID=UPI001EFE95F2|nr:DUF6538 domain-containing protein [Laribacter hongkongensis]MCG9096942.1 hypothetical protein [Laribacter hongkongensis]
MPQFMFKNPAGTGYLFRRGVPHDVRGIIRKREFKKALGGDFKAACRECNSLAVETDKQIEAAREALRSRQTRAHSFYDSLTVISDVTPELIGRVRARVLATADAADLRRRATLEPDMSHEEVKEAHLTTGELARHAWATGNLDAFRPALHQTLHLAGHRLADELLSTEQERTLLVEFVRAQRAAIGLMEARYAGEDPDIVLSAAPLQPVDAKAQATSTTASTTMMLSAAVADFIEHLPPQQRAMRRKHEAVLPALLDVIGDMPITELRQTHFNEFLRIIQKLPPRWADIRRRTRKTIQEIAGESEKCIALKTYEDTYIASLRAFLKRAVTDWQDIGFPTTLATNIPYTGTRTKSEYKQRALRTEEIELIFSNEKMKKIVKNHSRIHQFWLPAVGLYTGARIREICQINPQTDFGRDGEIWWLRITNESGDKADSNIIKSVKTGKSRTIPMHPELIRLGLPEYLAKLRKSGETRLFPPWPARDGDAGANAARWFRDYLKSIGLHGVANALGHAVRGAHAFRHTLLTHGRLAGVKLRCISGHSEASDNAVADGYEDETLLLPLEEMQRRLSQLNYGVTLPMPVAPHFSRTPSRQRARKTTA